MGFKTGVAPEETNITLSVLVDCFQSGVKNYQKFWKKHLSSETFQGILKIPQYHIIFPKDLWSRTVFDFAIAYNKAKEQKKRDEIVESMIPLYFGYIASFVNETEKMNTAEAENVVEDLCQKFEAERKYLMKNWTK